MNLAMYLQVQRLPKLRNNQVLSNLKGTFNEGAFCIEAIAGSLSNGFSIT